MVRCLDTWNGLVPTIFSIEPEDKKKARAKTSRFYTQTNPEFGLHFTQKRMIDSFREMFWIGFQVISWSKLFYRTRWVHLPLFFDPFLRACSTLFSKSFSLLMMRYSFIDTLRVCVVSFVRKVVRHNEHHFTSIIFTGIRAVNIGISPSISQFKWHLRPSTFHSRYKRRFAYL